jgi:hypothetical protein
MGLVASACNAGGLSIFGGGDARELPDAAPDQLDGGSKQDLPRGVVLEPRHGAVALDGAATPLTFAGYHSEPGHALRIQTLDVPDDLATWTTVATANTATNPSDGGGLYAWQVSLPPEGAGQYVAARWPAGGLLRVRVVDANDSVLSSLFHDSDECLVAAEPNWLFRAQACGATLPDGMVLVSPSPDPTSGLQARPRFLDRKGAITEEQTALYYAAIGAPTTLAAFRTRYGFFVGDDVAASYYNEGDLRVGREMHCKTFTENGQTGVACYSANYGAFSGPVQQALDLAIIGRDSGESLGAFATVCMVYRPPITAPNAVQFMVYGATGGLINAAQLDTFGDNVSIPNNCLNCHGSQSSYNPNTNEVTNARFLPFDVAAFIFPADARYTLAAQQENFRLLNQLVYGAGATPAIRELIDGMYHGGLDVPGTLVDPEFVPPAWSESREAAQTYLHAIAPYCRGCHASTAVGEGPSALDFSTPASLRAANVRQAVCGVGLTPHDMPNAEVVLRRFWESPARAYLVSFLSIPGSCRP